MVYEIILAIDPALQKIEEILLWKNKIVTSIIFTACNITMWLLHSFNIRSYCAISILALIFHLLDAYRTKMRKRLKMQNNKGHISTDVNSSIGNYIIHAYNHGTSLFQTCLKLKRRNPVKYFLVMLTFWTLLAIFGMKVKGFYVAYVAFWIIFFIPAIIHYNLPRRLLHKMLPLLEQLDRSMEYERRSVIDSKDLLVNVKIPQSDVNDDDEIDDEFKIDEFEDERKLRKQLTTRTTTELSSSSTSNELEDDEEEDEDEDEEFDEEDEDLAEESDEENESEEEEDEEALKNRLKSSFNTKNTNKNNNVKERAKLINSDSMLSESSFLPNDTMPSLHEVDADLTARKITKSTNIRLDDNDEEIRIVEEEFIFQTEHFKNIGDKIKLKKAKNRPSLFEQPNFFQSSSSSSTTTSTVDKQDPLKSKQQSSNNQTTTTNNDKDIDDTFDFLEEELNKNEILSDK